MATGAEPIGLLATAVKVPVVAAIWKTEMLEEFWLPTKSSFPVASFMMKFGDVPAG